MRAAIADAIKRATVLSDADNHVAAIEQYKLARTLASRLGEQETINLCTDRIGEARRHESIARFHRGVEDWNEWASGLLADREAKQAQEDWTEEAEEAWQEAAFVDFSNHTFELGDEFSRHVFPAEVCFEGATFPGTTSFRGTTFHGPLRAFNVVFSEHLTLQAVTFKDFAGFSRSTVGGRLYVSGCSFQGQALFVGLHATKRSHFFMCHFRQSACFEEASFDQVLTVSHSTFLGEASFLGATFSHWLQFRHCAFRDAAVFQTACFQDAMTCDNTTFSGYTSFLGSQFAGMCTFSDTRVKGVPVFADAHFNEPPTLDGLDGLSWKDAKKHKAKPKEISLPVRWRALRRLAQQAGNDERALHFFQAEVRARRGIEDRPWHVRYWVGYAFDVASGFGLSVSKPIGWLVSVLFGGALLYWYVSPSEEATYSAALLVSFCHTAPFNLFRSSSSLELGYALLGWKAQAGATAIPGWMTVAGAIQASLTSALLFLALLAIRNWFRIR